MKQKVEGDFAADLLFQLHYDYTRTLTRHKAVNGILCMHHLFPAWRWPSIDFFIAIRVVVKAASKYHKFVRVCARVAIGLPTRISVFRGPKVR